MLQTCCIVTYNIGDDTREQHGLLVLVGTLLGGISYY